MSVMEDDERTQLLQDDGRIDEEQRAQAFTGKLSAGERGGRPVTRTPLPWGQISIILLLNATEPLVFELIFPFVNQMILQIGVVDDPEEVGFYSGLIESIFAIMSFIAILPCSYISDHYGRKPVTLFGILGLGLSTFFFGLSRSYWFMIATRCLGGTLGGTMSAMKIMLAELSDKTNQGQAFSYLSISYRTGQLLGQPLGGVLSHPERQWTLFQHQFWYDYPYALPCFVAAIFAVVSAIIGYIWLEETLPSKRKRHPKRPDYGSIGSRELSEATLTDRDSTREPDNMHVPPVQQPPVRWLAVLTPSFISLLMNNFVMVFTCECIFVLYPLFAFSPIKSGGLGLSELAIGIHLAARAVINIISMFFYAPLEHIFGPVKLYQVSMFIWPLNIMSYPLLNYFARVGDQSTLFFNALLLGYFVVWSLACMTWTGCKIMVINAAPSAESIATLNGVSQMTISLAQAIAPAFVTSLFAFSIQSGIAGGNLIYAVLLVFSCGAAVHSLALREPTHDWRQEYREQVSD